MGVMGTVRNRGAGKPDVPAMSYIDIFRATPEDRIRMIRLGVPATKHFPRTKVSGLSGSRVWSDSLRRLSRNPAIQRASMPHNGCRNGCASRCLRSAECSRLTCSTPWKARHWSPIRLPKRRAGHLREPESLADCDRYEKLWGGRSLRQGRGTHRRTLER